MSHSGAKLAERTLPIVGVDCGLTVITKRRQNCKILVGVEKLRNLGLGNQMNYNYFELAYKNMKLKKHNYERERRIKIRSKQTWPIRCLNLSCSQDQADSTQARPFQVQVLTV